MKECAKGIKLFMKKRWLTIWLLVVIVSLFSMVASAAFLDGFTSMKRVVVATAKGGKMFSSDWLTENGIQNKNRRRQRCEQLSAQQIAAGNTYNVMVHLWNYDPNNNRKHYGEDITYVIKASMVDADGNAITAEAMGEKKVIVQVGDESYELDKNNLVTGIQSATQTLISNQSATLMSENECEIKFSGDWDFTYDSNIYVKLEAIRTGSSANQMDILDLGGMIGITKSEAAASSGWNGELKEMGTASNYDGYNFVLTGSGKATIEFAWDTSKIALNKYFYYIESGTDLRNIAFDSGEVIYEAPTEETGTWARVVIYADASKLRSNGKYRNRYEFQLYKISVEEPINDFISVSTSGPATRTGKWGACTIDMTSE